MTVQATRPAGERTARRYESGDMAERVVLARASMFDPDLRERLQLALMRGSWSGELAGIGAVAARDRYYESTHGGDWPEDH